VIQRAGSSKEGDAKPFYFTSFIDYVPKVMINVELGDAGVVKDRSCGCLLEEIGLDKHLSGVRSFSRATSEGMAAGYGELTRITEEVLPPRYGGNSVDYQWVEYEDDRSQSRLVLRVTPRIGPVNEVDMVKDILEELRRVDMAHRIYAEIWRQAGTIKVVRESPRPTSAGKISPFISERKA
jgi:hypothetical protein